MLFNLRSTNGKELSKQTRLNWQINAFIQNFAFHRDWVTIHYPETNVVLD